jgi:hypothetical protein
MRALYYEDHAMSTTSTPSVVGMMSQRKKRKERGLATLCREASRGV